MKQSYDLDLFYNMLVSYLDELEVDTDFPAYFYQALYDGENKLKSLAIRETKKFDDHWIAAILAYYPSIDKIVKNFKSALRVEEDVVIIEKVRRTSARSVKHLAANTHLLKQREDGENKNDYMPKKLLVEEREIEFGIYENRFVMTLINRLSRFIAERIKILKEDIDTKQYRNVQSKIAFGIDQSTYTIDVDLQEIESVSEGKIEEQNQLILKKAEELEKRINALISSNFMRELKGYKEVRAPILKTQIILKNVDYRNCYLLWQYLDQYNQLGYELIREEKQKRFNESYRKHLTQAALFSFATFMYHDKFREKGAKLDMRRFKVKKAQTIKLQPEDLVTDPKAYEIEDNKINEYYLNKNKQIFKKIIDQYFETENRYDIALRKALKDTIEITNSLYASYFAINADDDVFSQLIKPANPKLELEDADLKFKIASIIREVKEQDFKRAVALEKKWYQQVIRYQKSFFKYVKEENADFLKREAAKVKKTHEQYLKFERAKMLEDMKLQVAKDNETLTKLKNRYRDQYKKESAKIAEMQRKKAEAQRAKLQAERAKTKERLRLQKEKLKEKQKAYVRKQKEQISSTHKKAMETLRKKR